MMEHLLIPLTSTATNEAIKGPGQGRGTITARWPGHAGSGAMAMQSSPRCAMVPQSTSPRCANVAQPNVAVALFGAIILGRTHHSATRQLPYCFSSRAMLRFTPVPTQ